MKDKVLTALYWTVVVVAALALLPLTLIAAWFVFKSHEAELEALEATEHYSRGIVGDE